MRISSRDKSIRIKQKGFTLAELVVTMVLFSIVAMIAINAILFVGKMNQIAKQSANSFEESERIKNVLQNFFGQAVQVDWTSSPIGNIGENRGKIRRYSSILDLHGNQDPVAVGVFLRDVGFPNRTVSTSDIRATGVYFKNPTPKTQGKLLISSSVQGFGDVVLSSAEIQQHFDSITEFQLSSTGLNDEDGAEVRVLKLRFVLRKFLSGSKAQYRWCPKDKMQTEEACETEATYKDSALEFIIPLYNNAIDTGFTNEFGDEERETLFGNLYFFHFSGGL